MKKLITILSILTLSLGIYADDLKTKDILITEYSSITNEDESIQTSERKAYVVSNADSIAVFYNEIMTEIPTRDTAFSIKTPLFVTMLRYYANYIGLPESDAYTFRVATVFFGPQGQKNWIKDNNILYTTLKSDDFIIDGWKIYNANITRFTANNKDYETYKTYYSNTDLSYTNIKLIKDYILSMSNSTEAYAETVYWENVFINSTLKGALKAIQDLQDIIYLRTTRASKLK